MRFSALATGLGSRASRQRSKADSDPSPAPPAAGHASPDDQFAADVPLPVVRARAPADRSAGTPSTAWPGLAVPAALLGFCCPSQCCSCPRRGVPFPVPHPHVPLGSQRTPVGFHRGTGRRALWPRAACTRAVVTAGAPSSGDRDRCAQRSSLLLRPGDRSRRGPLFSGPGAPRRPVGLCVRLRGLPQPHRRTTRAGPLVKVALCAGAPVRCIPPGNRSIPAPSNRCQAPRRRSIQMTAAVKRPRHVARDAPLPTRPLARFAPPPATRDRSWPPPWLLGVGTADNPCLTVVSCVLTVRPRLPWASPLAGLWSAHRPAPHVVVRCRPDAAPAHARGSRAARRPPQAAFTTRHPLLALLSGT